MGERRVECLQLADLGDLDEAMSRHPLILHLRAHGQVAMRLGVVMGHGPSGLFTIQVGPYIFLAQNCIRLEPSP